MSDQKGQSGGINISGGSVGSIGDVVGGDKITLNEGSRSPLDEALRPVLEAIKGAPPQVKPDAEAKLAAIKEEAAKGEGVASDGVISKLLNELVELVPAAASAVGSAFVTPVLGGLVGPATAFVLHKLRGK
jgi:hypothetical protein